MAMESLDTNSEANQIPSLRWWHHIDLGFAVTPGRSDIRQQRWVSRCVPDSLCGLRVLDVGAWDGYFSFLAESRGATSVTALDSFQNEGDHADTPKTFDLAKRILRSSVTYVREDILDYKAPAQAFDVVFFFGVYYHMMEPLAALKKIRSLLRPGGKLYLEGLIRLGNQPDLHYYSPQDIEPTTFCAGSIACLERMSQMAGFSSVRLVSRTDGIQTKAWFYSRPPSKFVWGLISLFRQLVFPRARPRAFLEITA